MTRRDVMRMVYQGQPPPYVLFASTSMTSAWDGWKPYTPISMRSAKSSFILPHECCRRIVAG